ncbi:hypothetical protein Cgig2_013343 [Carnegiea gigantea]|uniref:Uncharacterized protein n=1 Tax=Carnegiea gigantea TaxID=171969 RepID=A0A9Q1GPM7_9CARY|nr:hypothetical protein Cgig2_013343 [Carnegiea gigantea]
MRFTHEALFVEDLKRDPDLASFTNEVRHKGLSEKFIIEQPTTIEQALKMIERYIKLEAIMKGIITLNKAVKVDNKRVLKSHMRTLDQATLGVNHILEVPCMAYVMTILPSLTYRIKTFRAPYPIAGFIGNNTNPKGMINLSPRFNPEGKDLVHSKFGTQTVILSGSQTRLSFGPGTHPDSKPLVRGSKESKGKELEKYYSWMYDPRMPQSTSKRMQVGPPIIIIPTKTKGMRSN